MTGISTGVNAIASFPRINGSGRVGERPARHR